MNPPAKRRLHAEHPTTKMYPGAAGLANAAVDKDSAELHAAQPRALIGSPIN